MWLQGWWLFHYVEDGKNLQTIYRGFPHNFYLSVKRHFCGNTFNIFANEQRHKYRHKEWGFFYFWYFHLLQLDSFILYPSFSLPALLCSFLLNRNYDMFEDKAASKHKVLTFVESTFLFLCWTKCSLKACFLMIS